MGFMTGNGKIARLPCASCDELNRRMDDGQIGKDSSVVERIAGSRKTPGEQFAGRPISKQNLSEWKAGLSRRSLSAKAVAIAFGWPGGKHSPRPADDGDFRQGLNHENYQTNPFRAASPAQHNSLCIKHLDQIHTPAGTGVGSPNKPISKPKTASHFG